MTTSTPKRVFITGANRGLGLSLAGELIGRGHEVWGAARADDPSALAELGPAGSIRVDVADPASIDAAVAELGRRVDGLDVLVNNAGIDSRSLNQPGEGRGAFDVGSDVLAGVLQVNTVGPMAMAKAARPLLARGRDPLILNVSSQLGSMELAGSMGGDAAYCVSKAALNMLTLKAAPELRDDGIAMVAVHPGWVATDMGGPSASLSPARSAAALADLVESLTMADTGRFLRWDGTSHPW